MSDHSKPHVLVVGAGAMGMITGYVLSHAGVDVTFLIRPHRAAALDQPQILYCYDDNSLKEYKGYKYITNPSEIVSANYDYIVITLDGIALRNETGVKLVKTIGEAARERNTKVIVGTVFVDVRNWFLQVSGLAGEQVANGNFTIHVYATKSVTLPATPPTDPELVAKADFAYTDKLGDGFVLSDASTVANSFAEVWNSSGISRASVKPDLEYTVGIDSFFAVLAGCELLDFPKFKDIDTKGEIWKLAIAAMKEIQCLGIHGELGPHAAAATTEEGLAAMMAGMEQAMLPFDLQDFNRYHHGGKVNPQDRELLRTCISLGEAEGKPMSSLKEILRRVEEKS